MWTNPLITVIMFLMAAKPTRAEAVHYGMGGYRHRGDSVFGQEEESRVEERLHLPAQHFPALQFLQESAFH